MTTISLLKEKFTLFNGQIFAGRLPEPVFSLCEVKTFVAQYKSSVRHLPDGRREHYDHQIRFSTLFPLSERELEDTLIHEMIHYFIAYNGLEDRTAHGPLFKALMANVNEFHGRGITISHRTMPGTTPASTAAKWHIVAILHFSSGELGVKVLPRVIPKVVKYYRDTLKATNVSAIDLYLHNDPYFNRFPTSVGRRCHLLSSSDATAHLAGARRLHVEGNRLIQR